MVASLCHYIHLNVRSVSFVKRISRRFHFHLENYCLHSTLSTGPDSVIFSGIQPTGLPHLGNYFGALQQWVKLQDSVAPKSKLYFSIVDLHAITSRQDPQALRRWKVEALATLLAAGLDPKKCTIFFQSDVPAHSELMWILSCNTSMGYLSRMTQWKSKLALPDGASPIDGNSRSKLKLGLFSYPVLQAADILVHGATHVPVGEDQVQHLEFTRECARNFNSAYSPILQEPQVVLSQARRVMSLKSPLQKMSKSHEDPLSRIILTDSPDEIRKKVKHALTDSISGISYNSVQRPGVANLLEILSCFDKEEQSCESLAKEHQRLTLRGFKDLVSDSIIDNLSLIRIKYQRLTKSDQMGTLKSISQAGAHEARLNAEKTMLRVREAIGL